MDTTQLLDQKDIAILRLLQENAKFTVKEIAGRVNLSITPVYERIKKMEENGIITQYVALVNHASIGKGLIVFCYVSLKDHNRKAGQAFVSEVIKFDEIVECYNISGEFDFMLKIVVKDMEQYHYFYARKLCELKGINLVRSTFIMAVLKSTHKLV